MKRLWIGLLLAPVLLLGGCVVNDGRGNYYDNTETIRYINETQYYVDNWIDGHYVGTVPHNGTLEVEGDYEGTHTFESESEHSILTWGPKDVRIYDGDVIELRLVEGGGYRVQVVGKVKQ